MLYLISSVFPQVV